MSEAPEQQPVPAGLVGAGAVLVALGGAFLWLLVLAGPWRLASGLLETADRVQRAEDKLSAGQLDKARADTAFAIAASERARAGLDGRSPLLDLAELIPVADNALGEIDHFVRATEFSSEAAFETVGVADDAIGGTLISPDPDDPEGGSIIDIAQIEDLAGRVHGVRIGLQKSAAELEQVDPQNLPSRFRPKLEDAIEAAAEADARLADAEAGFEVLPGILGADGPRTYLLGFQNNAEQRGTGGAILQFSTLEIDGGKVSLGDKKKGSASSVYDIDEDRKQFDIPLPEDAWIVRQIPDAQRFGNSNWSPDWPLSADVMWDYAKAADLDNPAIELPDFDGFMAVDPFALQKMMPGVGPFETKSGNYITANRVVPFSLYLAYGKYPIPKFRRAVLRQVVDEFFARAVDPKRPTELLEGAGSALAEKRIQIWMTEPTEQQFIKHMAWDGAIRPAKGSDFVYVAEQNVGGNKLDYFSTQSTGMSIEIDGADAHVSTVLGVHNGVFTPQPRWIMGLSGPTHKPMLSLYVPGDATLEGTTVDGKRIDDPVPAAWFDGGPPEDSEAGKKVWSATLVVPPGEDASIGYDYTVPDVIRSVGERSVYRLVIQHQPKVNLEEMTIRLTLPGGARAVRAPGWTREGDVLVWTRKLREDTKVEVSWRN